MSLPYPVKNPQLDHLYKHFARRCYERSYAILRRAYRLGGTSAAYRVWKRADERHHEGQKMPHIRKAHLAAWHDFCRNCPELDITPLTHRGRT